MRKERPWGALIAAPLALVSTGQWPLQQHPPLRPAAALAVSAPPAVADRVLSAVGALCDPPCANGGLCLEVTDGAAAAASERGGASGGGFLRGLLARIDSELDRAPSSFWRCSCPASWSGPTCAIAGDVAVSEKALRLRQRLAELKMKIEQAAAAKRGPVVASGLSSSPTIPGPGDLAAAAEAAAAVAASPLGTPAFAPPLGSEGAGVVVRSGGEGAGAGSAADGSMAWPFGLPLAASKYDTLEHHSEQIVEEPTGTLSFHRQPNSTMPGNVEPANVQGISENSAEDLRAFRTNIVLQVIIVAVCFLFFSVGRILLPSIYQGEAADDAVPSGFCSWIPLSLALTVDDIIYDAGLDRGMFVQFLNFAIWTLLAVGVPVVLILSPLHFFYGGQAAGQDKLSQFDMANVKHGSWLCWVHAVTVWYVVLTVNWNIFSMKRPFVDKRIAWLTEMPAPRSTTVLIEDIPEGKNTSEGLERFFDEQVFGKPVVKCAYVVKDTTELLAALQKKKNVDEMLEVAKGRSRRDVVLKAIGGSESALMAGQIEAQQQVDRLRRSIDQSEEYNTNTAFVTFRNRRDAAIIMRLFTVNDHEEISVSLPPAPDDIIWEDLLPKGGHQVEHARELFGNILVFLLFTLFVPIVLWIAAIARWESLHATFGNLGFNKDPFAVAQENYPEQVALWNGLVGTLVLTALMSTVPTFLMWIFSVFFVMKGKARLQLKVQVWYFYFLVVFVLLVTAIGSSDFGLLQTVTFLVRNPLEIFPRLAEKMPSSTHFYLEYLLVQWGVQSLNITRYLNLIKYAALRQLYSAEEAKVMSEPEDQDFYGIGSLSARATLNLTIPLVFCTLSPFICFIGVIAFLVARLVHCYLFVFAETRKPDLGGDFFFRQLLHTQQGLFLYVILMTGVLMERSDSWVPGAISASSILYLSNSYLRFRQEFVLREMGLHEIDGKGPDAGLGIYAEAGGGTVQEQAHLMHYKQPELPAPPPPVAQPAAAMSMPSFFSWMGGGGQGGSIGAGASASAAAASFQSYQRPMGSRRSLHGSPGGSPRGSPLQGRVLPRQNSKGGAAEAASIC